MSTIMIPSARGEILEQGIEDIFREHCRLVYRTAYSITGSWQDAEDVLQTIFLRLLQREYPVEFTTSPGAYLYRASVNLSLNIVQARKRKDFTDDVESLEAPAVAATIDDGMQRLLLDAIAQLRPKIVEILILHYEHNYSDAVIAKMLGKSRGTIAVTLYRARIRLKKLMLRASSNERGKS
jgi:RNA polymerase sigma-70 factor (ECF subfamily)